MVQLILLLVLTLISLTNGGVPGHFFWKPRMGLDLAKAAVPPPPVERNVTQDDINQGLVVLLTGYQVGLNLLVISEAIEENWAYQHLNILMPHYYTNAYRWALRHMSLMTPWLSGTSGGYQNTHKVYKKRFNFMANHIPKFLRYLFPFISKPQWDEERKHQYFFKVNAEPTFSKHYRYPSKKFKNYISQSDSLSEE